MSGYDFRENHGKFSIVVWHNNYEETAATRMRTPQLGSTSNQRRVRQSFLAATPASGAAASAAASGGRSSMAGASSTAERIFAAGAQLPLQAPIDSRAFPSLGAVPPAVSKGPSPSSLGSRAPPRPRQRKSGRGRRALVETLSEIDDVEMAVSFWVKSSRHHKCHLCCFDLIVRDLVFLRFGSWRSPCHPPKRLKVVTVAALTSKTSSHWQLPYLFQRNQLTSGVPMEVMTVWLRR